MQCVAESGEQRTLALQKSWGDTTAAFLWLPTSGIIEGSGIVPNEQELTVMGTTADKIAGKIASQLKSNVVDLSGHRAVRQIFEEARRVKVGRRPPAKRVALMGAGQRARKNHLPSTSKELGTNTMNGTGCEYRKNLSSARRFDSSQG
jgi:hypothetical protein